MVVGRFLIILLSNTKYDDSAFIHESYMVLKYIHNEFQASFYCGLRNYKRFQFNIYENRSAPFIFVWRFLAILTTNLDYDGSAFFYQSHMTPKHIHNGFYTSLWRYWKKCKRFQIDFYENRCPPLTVRVWWRQSQESSYNCQRRRPIFLNIGLKPFILLLINSERRLEII